MISNILLSFLSNIAKKYPRDEKVFIIPDYRSGHQILENLSYSGTAWMNFRLATAFSLASEIAEEAIIKERLEILSGMGILAIMDDIFTRLADTGQLRYFEKHAVNKGIIEALVGTVATLRMHEISSGTVKMDAFITEGKAADIKLILSEYEKILTERNLIDKAGLIALALKCLKKKKPVSKKKFIVFSRCYMTGLEREFILQVAGDDLIVVEEGPVVGLKSPKGLWQKKTPEEQLECKTDIERLKWLFKSSKAPKPFHDETIEMFSAVGYRNEVREVFRRIATRKIPVDDVEVLYTDSMIYGREIYSLCEKLGVPVTFAEGVPSYLKSPGKAIMGFLMWMKNDFADIYLRRLLKSADLKFGVTCGEDMPGGTALAYLLRTSGVGWKRERYSVVLEKKIKEFEKMAAESREEDEKDKVDGYEKNTKNLGLLKKLCEDLLSLVPVKDKNGKIDFRKFCDGCEQFLKNYTRKKDAIDVAFVGNVARRFRMLGELVEDKILFEEAIDKLLNIVSGVRVGSSVSRPGHLHVSHYKHGSSADRRNTFVVGLDESRFPGRRLQDPVLLDQERIKINSDIELSEDKIRKNLFDMASLLSGLRGNITVSFSSYDVREERGVFPSSVMLQILRVKEGKPEADYAALLKTLGEPIRFSARLKGEPALDETGWWLNRLTETEVLKNGIKSVESIYPGIKEGLVAERNRQSDKLTEYDGKINPEGAELDPREKKELVMSSSRLEEAARCPFKYFLENILGVYKPEEVTKELNTWLDPMKRGSLLHEVFQVFAESMKKRGKVAFAEQGHIILDILKNVVKKYKVEIPPPSEVVFENEYTQLKRDTEIFLNINKQLKTDPAHLEMKFGTEGIPPVEVPLGNSKKIFLKGRIDRVDKAGEHEYHVWDYKPGGSFRYEEKEYVHGGEQLQHALYAVAAEKILRASGEDKDARVTKAGYLLSTEKGTRGGKGGIFARDTKKKELWQGALDTLLDLIAQGGFIMPDEPPCNFCDYTDICRNEKTREQFKKKLQNSENKLLDVWKALKDYD